MSFKDQREPLLGNDSFSYPPTESSTRPAPPSEVSYPVYGDDLDSMTGEAKRDIFHADVIYETLPAVAESDNGSVFNDNGTMSNQSTLRGGQVAMHRLPPHPPAELQAPSLPGTMTSELSGGYNVQTNTQTTTILRPRPVKQGPHFWPAWKSCSICCCQLWLVPLFIIFIFLGLTFGGFGGAVLGADGISLHIDGENIEVDSGSGLILSILGGIFFACACLGCCGAVCVKRTRVPLVMWLLMGVLLIGTQVAGTVYAYTNWEKTAGFIYKDVVCYDRKGQFYFEHGVQCCNWQTPPTPAQGSWCKQTCWQAMQHWKDEEAVKISVGSLIGFQALLLFSMICLCCVSKRDRRRKQTKT